MYGDNQGYVVMHIPESPIPPNVDEVILAYDTELDDISRKLDTFPSGLTMDEKRKLQARYDELIKLMVNRFSEKNEHIEFNDALTSLKNKNKGDNHAN
jgi:hypothetical protein